MKITKVEAIPTVIPHEAAYWDLGCNVSVISTVVSVETDEGITGWGYVGPNLPPPPRVEATIETEIQPLILGESPYDVEKIVAKYLHGFPGEVDTGDNHNGHGRSGNSLLGHYRTVVRRTAL